MCRNFTYEVVEQRRRLKAIKKIVAQTECFKYFFRVLHEASSSWLKYLHYFRSRPVYYLVNKLKLVNSLLKKKVTIQTVTVQ
jgi:hypothetical protein